MALTKVSSSLVSDNAITTGKLVDGGVHSADIADVAVTSAKIANNAILTQHIDDAQVTTDQLGADAVTAAKIADNAVSEEHLDITVITSLTAVTAATGDLLMVADVSDSNNLKKIPVSSILAGTHTGAVNTSGTINSGALGVTGNIAVSGTVDGIDIAARDAVLTSTTTTAGAALPKAGGTMTGNIAHASDFTIDAGGDIILDADGTQIILKDNGTEFAQFLTSSTPDHLYIRSMIQDKDIILSGNDNGSFISALTLDMSDAGSAYFNNKVGIGTTSPNTMLHVDIAASPSPTYPTLGTASGVLGLSINELHGMYLGADGSSGNGWIQAMREDGTGTAYNLVLQPSGGNVGIGTATPSSLLTVAGTSDLAWSAATSKLQISRSGAVARLQNYESGSASTNLALQWEGGKVGIGTSSPSYKADILATNQYALRLNTTDADGCFLAIQTNGTAKGYLGTSHHLVQVLLLKTT